MKHKILLIESDSAIARTLQDALDGAGDGQITVERVGRLSEGLESLKKEKVAAVILDLFLPDSQGIDTFVNLSLAAPHVPIVVLAGPGEEDIARAALARGAYDYLLKNRLDTYALTRALQSVISRKAVEDALFLEKERAQVTLNSIGDAVITTDISGNITYLNQVAELMTGWSTKEASGRPFADVFHIVDGDTREALRDPMQLAVKQDQTVRLSSHCVLIRRDGWEGAIEDSAAPIHSPHGETIGAVIVFHDVGEARTMALKITRLAQHDLLTDLPNRLLLNDRITQALALARRQGNRLAVLFLDLDGFKQINDTLGHTAGDKLLRLVAKRAVACVRGSDTVSGLGGDEFVVLLPEIADARDAAFTAEKILAAMASPFAISGHDHHLSGCIGISVYPEDGHTAGDLIKSADTAMYQGKAKGQGNFQFFHEKFNVPEVERKLLARNLAFIPNRQHSL
jgi:diguanylate cyclase (GGDEF)-like protein/PAS domain S-box-containing protein